MSWPITVEDFSDYLGDETAAVNDQFKADALAAAVETWSDETQREWTLVDGSTTASARTFLATNPYVLRIADCTEITSVVDNGTTISSSAYQPEPVSVGRTGAGRPYEQIRLLSGTWYHDPRGRATAVVTAKWGRLAIPQRAIEAVKIIAKDIVLNREVRFGIVAMTDAAAVSARTNTVVRSAILHYGAVEAWGIG